MNSSSQHVIALASDPRATQNAGWSDLVVGSKPEPTPAMVSALGVARQSAADHLREREDSFQRCDTDGFVSQWASGLNSDLERLRMRVLGDGGFAVFPALFRRDTGERVNAKLIQTKYGWSWAFVGADDKFTGRFLPDSRGKRARLYKEGLVVLGEWAPAKVYMAGSGHGLSGQAWPAVKRCRLEEREGVDKH